MKNTQKIEQRKSSNLRNRIITLIVGLSIGIPIGTKIRSEPNQQKIEIAKKDKKKEANKEKNYNQITSTKNPIDAIRKKIDLCKSIVECPKTIMLTNNEIIEKAKEIKEERIKEEADKLITKYCINNEDIKSQIINNLINGCKFTNIYKDKMHFEGYAELGYCEYHIPLNRNTSCLDDYTEEEILEIEKENEKENLKKIINNNNIEELTQNKLIQQINTNLSDGILKDKFKDLITSLDNDDNKEESVKLACELIEYNMLISMEGDIIEIGKDYLDEHTLEEIKNIQQNAKNNQSLSEAKKIINFSKMVVSANTRKDINTIDYCLSITVRKQIKYLISKYGKSQSTDNN